MDCCALLWRKMANCARHLSSRGCNDDVYTVFVQSTTLSLSFFFCSFFLPFSLSPPSLPSPPLSHPLVLPPFPPLPPLLPSPLLSLLPFTLLPLFTPLPPFPLSLSPSPPSSPFRPFLSPSSPPSPLFSLSHPPFHPFLPSSPLSPFLPFSSLFFPFLHCSNLFSPFSLFPFPFHFLFPFLSVHRFLADHMGHVGRQTNHIEAHYRLSTIDFFFWETRLGEGRPMAMDLMLHVCGREKPQAPARWRRNELPNS